MEREAFLPEKVKFLKVQKCGRARADNVSRVTVIRLRKKIVKLLISANVKSNAPSKAQGTLQQ